MSNATLPLPTVPRLGCVAAVVRLGALLVGTLCASCEGPFSALDPAGRDAEVIARLFWWMVGGGLLVWLTVMGLSFWAVRSKEHQASKTRLFIIGGGTVLPLCALSVLLTFGLSKMPFLLSEGQADAPVIRIVGEQWWWRIFVQMPDGQSFETANELRLPVGKRVTLEVESADVIHAFWVPSLSGKVDMIPGRTNRMALEPTRTGTFGGWCAEYCGLSHAQMRLFVHVVELDEFRAWVEHERAPAAHVSTEGGRLFASSGCGACHTIRGTANDGTIGPDLTHVGSRTSVGAGILANDRKSLGKFLTHISDLKPGAHMPAFDMLPPGEVAALAEYLKEQK